MFEHKPFDMQGIQKDHYWYLINNMFEQVFEQKPTHFIRLVGTPTLSVMTDDG
jgi:hypothetical protein